MAEKLLKDLDPQLYQLRNERMVLVNLHRFCDSCDYWVRSPMNVPESLASKLRRAFTVPHDLHGIPEGEKKS
jgi:hypothetical protein